MRIKVWQPERWAQSRLLQFLSEELEQRLTSFISLSHRAISPKSLLAECSGQKRSLSTLPSPLLPESDGPVRKHVRRALLWETPEEGLFPKSACMERLEATARRALLFTFCSAKILQTHNESEACWRRVMSGQTFKSKEEPGFF